MNRAPMLIPAVLALAACAGTPKVPADILAIQDFIAVTELPEVDRIRTDRRETFEELGNTRYIIFKTHRQDYLIEFRRSCWELRDDFNIKADHRTDNNNFYPGVDTFRGCPTGKAWELTEGQAEEIRNLGDAPSGS